MKYAVDVDDAIVKALFEGPKTYYNLFLRTREYRNCSRTTFHDHLKRLISEGRVLKEPPGEQERLLSLNSDTEEFVDSLIKIVNINQENVQAMLQDTENFYKKCKDVYAKKAKFSKDDRQLFAKPGRHIGTLLDGMKIISFLLATGDLPKSSEKKLTRLHTLHLNTLKKIFKMTKEVKASVSILIRPGLFFEV